MKTILDNFDSLTGWTVSGGASAIYALNDIKEYIAGDLTHSIILKFDGLNSYCEKVFTSPVSTVGYSFLTFSIASTQKGGNNFVKTDDFLYKIDLGSGKEYFLSVYTQLSDFTLDISDVTTIERIRITALHADTDYVIISYAVISEDEMPLDVFTALKEKIDNYITSKYINTYLAGTIIDAEIGDTSVLFITDTRWIERNSRILITDGINSGYHIIEKKEGKKIYFNSLDSGRKLINRFAYGTTVYLSIPCNFGMYQKEFIDTSISIWGLSPEWIIKETDVQEDLDTWKINGSVNSSITGKWYKYSLLIDCESHSVELLSILSSIVKIILGRHQLWINGKCCTIRQVGNPAMIEPTEIVSNIPKIQFTAEIEIKENIWIKTRLPNVVTITNDYIIQNGGVLP